VSKYVAPQCVALILCDAVIEDVRTHNKSLINMFNGVLSPQVPVRHDKMCAYASFTSGRGTVPIVLRICYDKEYEEDVLHLPSEVVFAGNNPMGVVDMVFEIRGLLFTRFGNYTFEVLCDGVPLLARRFTVTESQALKASEGEGEPPAAD
jgi:hypothetical protein